MQTKRPTVTWQEQSIARQRERLLARGLAEVEEDNQLQRDREAMSRAAIEPLGPRNRRAKPGGLAWMRFKTRLSALRL